MNEETITEKCNVVECNNKAYKKNRITPFQFEWVCRKHYKEFA